MVDVPPLLLSRTGKIIVPTLAALSPFICIGLGALIGHAAGAALAGALGGAIVFALLIGAVRIGLGVSGARRELQARGGNSPSGNDAT